MKLLYAVAVTVVMCCAFTVSLRIDEVVAALKAGNAAQAARYFDQTVEINLPDKGGSYSKSQAEIVLKDFFANNPVKGFEVIHQGQNAGSQYCIGTLHTKNGSFRTTIYMKQKGELQVLQEIRFESR